MENTIISTLGVVMFIIVILEILRYFRKSNSFMVEFEELKRRVEYLEDKINQEQKVNYIVTNLY